MNDDDMTFNFAFSHTKSYTSIIVGLVTFYQRKPRVFVCVCQLQVIKKIQFVTLWT